MTLLPRRAPAAVLDPIVRGLAAARVTPTMLTTTGFLGNVLAAWLAAEGELRLAGIAVLFFSALDMLDGALARAHRSEWDGRCLRLDAATNSAR